MVSSTTGNEPYLEATWSRPALRCRCCHSGVRRSGRRRGSSRARAAHSRKRLANSAEPPTSPTTRSSISSGSNRIESPGGASSASGSRTTTPSSVYMVWTSRPSRSRTRASMAWAHGAWTWAPNGE